MLPSIANAVEGLGSALLERAERVRGPCSAESSPRCMALFVFVQVRRPPRFHTVLPVFWRRWRIAECLTGVRARATGQFDAEQVT